MRKGFGLIFALFVIVLVAGLVSLALRYARSSIIKTTNIYEKENAELFLNNAVELSMLAISGYERNSTSHCLKHIHIISKDKRFTADVNVSKYYLFKGSDDCSYCGSLCQPIQTKESQGMAMLEIEVDSNNTNPKNSIPLRIIRRTLQRP